MSDAVAILSMLHEGPMRNSATRRFRNDPVLAWTLRRLRASASLEHAAILCWNDQAAAVKPIAEESGATVCAKGDRARVPNLEAVAAARRWADGWRGGLLGTCDFDLGFHALWSKDISDECGGKRVVLIDPSAALVDARLVDELIEHSRRKPTAEIVFSPAAPGLSGVLLRPELLEKLSGSPMHPGRMLHYLPDQPVRDPLGGDGCAAVPTPVARTIHQFKLDSDRQLTRITRAMETLNGQLVTTHAEGLVKRLESQERRESFPRDVRMELNTNRATSPIYWPGRHVNIARAPLEIETAKKIVSEIAAAADVRLTLAGVGDPLLADAVLDVIEYAKTAGIEAVSIETDLCGVSRETIARLAASSADIVCVNLPAISAQTYAAVMGVDAYVSVLDNLRALVELRQQQGRLVPLIAPVFTKCAANLGEMEAWYDQWLRAVGSAVIEGPSDFAGQIPDSSVADMSPPRRGACVRLASRMNVLCDGKVVACEQDILGRHVLGDVREESIAEIWQRVSAMRAQHQAGKWAQFPLCAGCREWHRP